MNSRPNTNGSQFFMRCRRPARQQAQRLWRSGQRDGRRGRSAALRHRAGRPAARPIDSVDHDREEVRLGAGTLQFEQECAGRPCGRARSRQPPRVLNPGSGRRPGSTWRRSAAVWSAATPLHITIDAGPGAAALVATRVDGTDPIRRIHRLRARAADGSLLGCCLIP
jgi:hypothetical protein